MRMGFKEQVGAVREFVEKNYPGYLDGFGIGEPFVTTEFIDFDRFKNDFVLFMELDGISFGPSPYADDCGGIQRMLLDVFLVFRNDTVANLDAKLMDASTAMYELLRNEKLHREKLDVADNLTVRTLDFFKHVEGNRNLVASRFSLELEMAY